MVPELGKTLNVGADYLKSFYDKWKAQSQGTADSINDDYNKQLAELQGMLALGEVSEKDAKDVYLKIQQERFDGLKRLREQNGTSTFKDAWTDMFAQIQAGGKDFARSITQDIGSAIEGLNQQLAQFVVTGKGLNLKQIGQSLEANLFTSVLKKGESQLAGAFGGLFGLGGKADGSSQTNALWVQFANGGFGGVGGSPDTSLAGFLNLGGSDTSNSGGSLLGGLFGGGGGNSSGDGGGIGSIFKSIGSLFGGFLAGGGDVAPGRAYVVGEKRPELFVPRSAGTIVPNVAMTGDNKNIAVTNHFHISTPDADSFKKSQSQISSAMGVAAQRGLARNGR
jgi:phage-related minor tail protein